MLLIKLAPAAGADQGGLIRPNQPMRELGECQLTNQMPGKKLNMSPSAVDFLKGQHYYVFQITMYKLSCLFGEKPDQICK